VGAYLVLAGCAAIPLAPSALPQEWVPSISPSPIPAEQADSPLGYTLGEQAAVRIRNVSCDGVSTGSGFILDEHTIVTNHHVVEGQGILEATLSDGTDVTVTGSAYATNADVAIITTAESLSPAVALSDTSATRGDTITVVGYPEGDVLVVSSGTIKALEADTLDNASFVFSTSAEAAPGSSGSAVYNDDGEVVGVLYAGNKDDGVTLVIPVVLLTSFLDSPALQVDNPPGCLPEWL
jgi:S1-C subfamily serine protease